MLGQQRKEIQTTALFLQLNCNAVVLTEDKAPLQISQISPAIETPTLSEIARSQVIRYLRKKISHQGYMKMRVLVAILTLIMSNSALACPQNIGENSSIRLTRMEPYYSAVFKRSNTGISEERVMDRDGKRTKVSSFYPHPILAGKRRSGSSSLSLEYSESLHDLDRINKVRTWRSGAILKSGRKTIGAGTAIVNFLGRSKVRIGNCRYKVWRIENKFLLDQARKYTFEQWYSPSLGLVLRSVKIGPDGKPVSAVAYDAIQIEYDD